MPPEPAAPLLPLAGPVLRRRPKPGPARRRCRRRPLRQAMGTRLSPCPGPQTRIFSLFSPVALTPLRSRASRSAALLAAATVAGLLVLVTLVLVLVPPPPGTTTTAAVNASKLALLVEDRPLAVLAPLVLHFMAVLAPDWGFLFLGSPASLAAVNGSAAVRAQVRAGRLALRPVPANASVGGHEPISRFLTSRWLYDEAVTPAEWLLVFQTDAMVCASSRLGADDFLAYDWVGAPWNPRGAWGGNGGLSLRRVAPIRRLLRAQRRVAGSEPEDVWLSERLRHAPASAMANGSVSLAFSAETHAGAPARLAPPVLADGAVRNAAGDLLEGLDDWRRGFYEPMGYHAGGGGVWLHGPVWGTPELRRHIWSYCPEVKMALPMDMAAFVPGNCGARWA